MECLFTNHFRPSTRLVDSILILGITQKTLRKMFLKNEFVTTPELIIQLPNSKKLSNHILKTVFHPFTISITTAPEYPRCFSTNYTYSNGKTEYLHCLMVSEEISPKILEHSKERRNPPGFMSFIKSDKEKVTEIDEAHYVPVVICLKSSAQYVDAFKDILHALYSHCYSLDTEKDSLKYLAITTEFIKTSMFLLNDLIIPPPSVQISFQIGITEIALPVEYQNKIHYFESNILILLDLLDIQNIIKIWEYILLGKSLVLCSSNDYKIYLVMQALISLIFPFKISQFCMPLAAPVIFQEILSNKPLILGINSSYLAFEDIIVIDPELNILDIDSNTMHCFDEAFLCDCIKCELGQKLQYLKAYYYVDRDRLNIYRMNAMGKNMDDQDFISRSQPLIDCIDHSQRDVLFVELVREVFFSVFYKSLHDYSKFTVYQSLTSSHEFLNDDFLETLQQCEKCTLPTFWRAFIQTKIFKEFVESSEKLDNFAQKKFNLVCGGIMEKSYADNSSPSFELAVTERLSSRGVFSRLKEVIGGFPKDTALNKYIFLTALELHKGSCSAIESLTQDPSASRTAEEFMTELEDRYFEGLPFDLPNIFYGDFCIIQILKGLIHPITRADFRRFSLDTEILRSAREVADTNPEALCLELLYALKASQKTWDATVVLGLAKKLEKLNAGLLPMYQVAEIMEKEMKSARIALEQVIEDSSVLKELANRISKSQDSMVVREGTSEIILGKKSSIKKKNYSGRFSERKHSQSPDNSLSG